MNTNQVTPKEKSTELRSAVAAEMYRYEIAQRKKWDEKGFDFIHHQYCTWWFVHHIHFTNRECRKELERMEREGLVTANREQSNNTKWILTEAGKSFAAKLAAHAVG